MTFELRHDRRELLLRLGRLALLTALSATGLSIALRRRGPAPAVCRDACRGCAALGGCGLPAAAAHRRERGA